MYKEPHTHPIRPDQGRIDTDQDVLDVALQLRDMLSNEEIWYILQQWKKKVITEYEDKLADSISWGDE